MDPERVKELLTPRKNADKTWYLDLLDEEKQTLYEEDHLLALLKALRAVYIAPYQKRIAAAKAEADAIRSRENYGAEDYRELLIKNAEIAQETKGLNSYKCFFSEPYFARMDVVDPKEGYNSYYIGKKGDVKLEIVDWRAPFAVRYYQKSRVDFSINGYDYHTVLRRALSVKSGKLLDFKNEYLSVKDVLTEEEIAGRDEEILFDPYLRSIIKSRKDDTGIRDIIRTIQEQQFAVITLPERESFVLQGCAGSGKTMILLHRLSYLMYNNEALSERDVLVITPSDSFNAFIDELSQVLELEKVRTTTIRNYFFRALKNEGIDLAPRLGKERESGEYLSYIYSARFRSDVQSRIRKLYDGIFGMFASEDCRNVAEEILTGCEERQNSFTKIKNASLRVRRAVLGELKDSKEGGFYFTKPFRALMSAFVGVEDFLEFVLRETPRTPDYFFRQFVDFYRSVKYVATAAERVFAEAQRDLAALSETADKEIADLKRYRVRGAEGEVYTYRDRIERREALKAEAAKISGLIGGMAEGVGLLFDFYGVLRSSAACAELGKCRDRTDVARWLYRETVKRAKTRFGLKGIFPSDGYAILYVLAAAGRKISPRYGLVFVDEGQDISEGEYELLKRIHSDAAFNVFGDLKQNITPFRGLSNWDFFGGNVYSLDQNYRNTNEIVDFVSNTLDVKMKPIGLSGGPVAKLRLRQVTGFFRDGQGLKAVIAREEYLPLFKKRGYAFLSETGKVSKTKINVMTVFESKGLEFTHVAVYDRDMTENEKYIAYTRALSRLAVVEGE